MERQAEFAPYLSPRDLSRVDPLALGQLHIDPPTRTITGKGGSRVLEPRVMQVLVALVQADGMVLTRDDLIAMCWDGRIVGDNAINRVISLLRQALFETAGEAVRLETITKVGFRIVATEAGQDAGAGASGGDRPSPGISRRALVAGATGLVAAAGLGLAAWNLRRAGIDPKAADLYRRGQLLQRTGEPGTMDQAMAFYKQAVQISPDFADAWGAMAIGYYHAASGFSRHDNAAYAQLMRSAARRALDIDPTQADAAAALVLAKGWYGRLFEAERDLRQLVADHPGYWYGNARLGIFLRQVGRIRDSLPFTNRTLSLDPMLPVGWAKLAVAQVQLGEIQEADVTLDNAARNWPSSWPLWFSRYTVLMQTGRYGEARRFVENPQTQPGFMDQQTIDVLSRTAEATLTGDAASKRRSSDELAAIAAEDPSDAPLVGWMLATLGDSAAAFKVFGAYYPPIRDSREGSAAFDLEPLFYPSVLRFRESADYKRLLVETGLEEYWMRSGSQPDFRRG
ncbi:MAG: hypothetical protein GC147_00480 [Porphyrobacter sp.]|nr:hypothetical protein [Porphyrobacter sp.]